MKFTLAFLSGIAAMVLLAAVTNTHQNNFPITTTLSTALFMNCANEVIIELPEGKEDATYTAIGASIVKGENRGQFTLTPEAELVTLTVSYNGVEQQYRFRAYTPPAPDISLLVEGKMADTKVGMIAPGPAALVIRAEANTWVKTLIPRDARYKVSEWNVILVRGKRPVAQQRFLSEAGNLTSFKSSAQPGDRILVEIIKVSRLNFKNKTEEVNMTGKTTFFNIPLN